MCRVQAHLLRSRLADGDSVPLLLHQLSLSVHGGQRARSRVDHSNRKRRFGEKKSQKERWATPPTSSSSVGGGDHCLRRQREQPILGPVHPPRPWAAVARTTKSRPPGDGGNDQPERASPAPLASRCSLASIRDYPNISRRLESLDDPPLRYPRTSSQNRALAQAMLLPRSSCAQPSGRPSGIPSSPQASEGGWRVRRSRPPAPTTDQVDDARLPRHTPWFRSG